MNRLDEDVIETHEDAFEVSSADIIRIALNHLVKFASTTQVFPQAFVNRLNQKLPTRRDEMIALIVSLFKDNDTLRKYYEHMDILEKALIEEIVHDPTQTFDYLQFEAKYGTVPKFVYPDRYGQSGGTRFYPLSLIMSKDGYMPLNLKTRFLTFVPKPKSVRGAFVDQLPSHLAIHQTEQAALHDVKAVLRLIFMNKLSVSPTTYQITKASAQQISKVLLVGDFYPPGTESEDQYDVKMGEEGIRPFAWALLVQAGKLCKAEGSKLKLTSKGQVALNQPAPLILKDLWEKWIDTTLIHELNRVDVVKGQYSRSHPLRSADECRECIESAILELSVGKWMGTEEFEKFLIAHGHGFEVARNEWDLYISDKQYGSFGYDNNARVLNRRYVFAFLLEYAATLGIIDVALTLPWESDRKDLDMWGADCYSCLSRYDGLMYLRLTPLGAWILGLAEKYTEKIVEQTTSFKITPNLEINVIADKIMPADELFLERIGEKISERVWKLSRQKILTAIEEGMEPGKINEFLLAQSEEIPQTVEAFLKDITDRTKKVKYAGPCWLMECVDENIALLMANDTTLKKLIIVANQRFLVVRQEDEKKFRNQLKRIGYVL